MFRRVVYTSPSSHHLRLSTYITPSNAPITLQKFRNNQPFPLSTITYFHSLPYSLLRFRWALQYPPGIILTLNPNCKLSTTLFPTTASSFTPYHLFQLFNFTSPFWTRTTSPSTSFSKFSLLLFALKQYFL